MITVVIIGTYSSARKTTKLGGFASVSGTNTSPRTSRAASFPFIATRSSTRQPCVLSGYLLDTEDKRRLALVGGAEHVSSASEGQFFDEM